MASIFSAFLIRHSQPNFAILPILRWLDTVFKKMEIYDFDPYFWKIITCSENIFAWYIELLCQF